MMLPLPTQPKRLQAAQMTLNDAYQLGWDYAKYLEEHPFGTSHKPYYRWDDEDYIYLDSCDNYYELHQYLTDLFNDKEFYMRLKELPRYAQYVPQQSSDPWEHYENLSVKAHGVDVSH